MMLPSESLNAICPLHAVLDARGRILQAGPTLQKLGGPALEGRPFLSACEVYRPRAIGGMAALLQTRGRKLHLRLRNESRTPLKGMVVPTGDGGAVVNLSFGIALMDTVRDFSLTSTDFATTDPAIEMLWLMEAQSAAMDLSRNLNLRLQGAMTEAEERAFTDALTGLRNRRALDAVMERIVRQKQPYSLMHLDLDLFKQVNDTLGHAAGDEVLRQVARVMLEETRHEDTVSRVGGDEFVVVCTGFIRAPRLAALARRLIRRIEEPVPWEGTLARISASIGIVISVDGRLDPATAHERADAALYDAKRAGRAQFTFAPGSAGAARLAMTEKK
ncbi:GGDEF domain-containing protein [Sagittula salina]|uniref:diguanylate cyclase n=1 Tax=Sagittula salina TaxID=2820268 RepID=A0A940S2F5_9RHOB|nr:GGDEF domain-containing protein [Sagittula salina]MBP0484037.1 GGDEF domain-containing protein [Sagittula salina]